MSGVALPRIQETLANALRHHQTGHLNEAEKLYLQILQMDSRHTGTLHLLGVLYHQLGRNDLAVDLIVKAIAMNGQVAAFHSNLGLALQAQGRYEEAAASYRRAVILKPAYVEAHNNLGIALQAQGKLEEAVASFERAVAFRPDYPEAHSNLGHALKKQGKFEAAVIACERAVALNPDFAEAYGNLGLALQAQNKFEEAAVRYRRAVTLNPDFPEAHNNLGNALSNQGRLEDAVASYRRAALLNPEDVGANSNLLLTLNYQATRSPDELYAEHRSWGSRYDTVVRKTYRNDFSAERRLRIGYVSPDFRRHSVPFFFEPLLREHDRQQFELFCYADVAKPDSVTVRLEALADNWRFTVGISDEALAWKIGEDGIDILVDLAGHTANNRLLVFAAKPSPVQVTWLGYPHSTGLTAIDYRLVDAVTDPAGKADLSASETLLRLAGCFLCYVPPAEAPDPVPCLGEDKGHATFGSFNNPAKISGPTLDAWAMLLNKLPGSRLLLKGAPLADAHTRALLQARLVERGVAAERVTLRGQIPNFSDHLGFYREIDIALDPFPYNGTTTTCEALWMGVPVVTLLGDRHAARVGASLLTQMGLTELIANSVEEYVQIALALGGRPWHLRDLRRSLRPQMATSALCDGYSFARKMEAAFRTMWQHWCKRTL